MQRRAALGWGVWLWAALVFVPFAGEPVSKALPPGGGLSVKGRLVGPFRVPLAGLRVACGDQVTTTDGDGSFSFRGVQPPYDIAFRVEGSRTNATPELWTYRGLTRSDPTLQADHVPGRQDADLWIERKNVSHDRGDAPFKTSETKLGIAFGSAQTQTSGIHEEYGGLSYGFHWIEGAEIPTVLHGLSWWYPASAAPDGLSNVYLSYHERRMVIRPGNQKVEFDFSPNRVKTAEFSAAARADWGDASRGLRNLVGLLVFDSNALLWLVDKRVQDGEVVTAPLPVLEGAHTVFHAEQRGAFEGSSFAFGAAHREVGNGREPTVLVIPKYRELEAPANGTGNVDAHTEFSWSRGPGVAVLTVYCGRSVHHVVTARHRAHFPASGPLDFPLPRAARCSWTVEVHGSYPSMDAAANEHGMMDASPVAGRPERGSMRGEGSYTRSVLRELTTAP